MANSNKIVFYVGDENKIVKEKITRDLLDNSNSMFADTYKHVFKILDNYFNVLSNSKQDEEKAKFDQDINNIFAFIGDRGSGKSSCMQSVVYALSQKKITDALSRYKSLNDREFYAINTIDPSSIDYEKSFIGVLLATLFNEFKDYVNSNHVCENKQISIVKKFTEVQKDFSTLINHRRNDKDKEMESLESLASLSASINLRNSLKELIKEFLTFIDHSNATLIVTLDDIDLNSENATAMAEEIRKYLIMDNVIVLIALKLDQLHALKKLQYADEYEMSKFKDLDIIDAEELDQMTEKYMTKLIPNNHRFYLPELAFNWNSELVIMEKTQAGNDGNQSKQITLSSVRQGILELVYRKTHKLFYNSSIKTNNLIPENLREFRQLIRLLYDMEDATSDPNGPIKEKNNALFETYLFDSWAKNHLLHSSVSLIDDLRDVEDPIQINTTAMRIIRKKFSETLETLRPKESQNSNSNSDEQNEYTKELNAILDFGNFEYNIALGDVLAVISYLENRDITDEESDFLFLIKVFYTFKLHKYFQKFYNEVFYFMYEPKQDGNILFMSKNAFDGYKLSNYSKLIGGRLFNPIIMCSWPASRETYKNRLYRTINIKPINDTLKKWDKEGYKKDKVDINELRLIEFFMLGVSHPNWGKNKENLDYRFRQNSDLVYHVSMANRDKAFFDLGAFFCNIADIENCYSRFSNGDRLLSELKGDNKDWLKASLYSQFTNTGNVKIRRFAKWIHFVNVEILIDIVNTLDDHNVRSGNDIDMLKEFFECVQNYHLGIYRDGTNKPKVLDIYDHISIVVNLLNHISNNSSDSYLFNVIFNDYKEDVEDLGFGEEINKYLQRPAGFRVYVKHLCDLIDESDKFNDNQKMDAKDKVKQIIPRSSTAVRKTINKIIDALTSILKP